MTMGRHGAPRRSCGTPGPGNGWLLLLLEFRGEREDAGVTNKHGVGRSPDDMFGLRFAEYNCGNARPVYVHRQTTLSPIKAASQEDQGRALHGSGENASGWTRETGRGRDTSCGEGLEHNSGTDRCSSSTTS